MQGARTSRFARPQRVLGVMVLAGATVALIFVASVFGYGVFAQDSGDTTGDRAKNVIFVLGDGLGLAQRDAIQLSKVGPYDRLAMDRLPYQGLSNTNAEDPETFVTDSAAGATALATGVKTYNGSINVDNGGDKLTSIMKQAKAQGKAIGVVTTSQVTDASPASFGGASVSDRYAQSEIARQLIEDVKVDVILGGGEDYWYPEGNEGAYPDNPPKDPEEESQSDRGNLVRRAKDLGYTYVSDPADLGGASGRKILGLFANQEMFEQNPEGEGDIYAPKPTLPIMTNKAIKVLSRDPDGFFLFVEEEAIDEMAHNNNARLMLKGGRSMDKTVSEARFFADGNGQTLLITTGDHETGGLTVEATDDPEYPDESGGGEEDPNANLSVEDGPFRVANSDYRMILDWTTTAHTGADVPLTASGPGGRDLVGNYQNTHVYDAMADALGIPRAQRSKPAS
ncbi:MAG TPA: alkaline phosphatase [Rubrobacter sp.]|nr:alkaline phosphatase [Rubrobacter sp.]